MYVYIANYRQIYNDHVNILTIYYFNCIFQSTLVCAFPLDAIPCEDSEAFMNGPDSINARFGQVDDSGPSEDYSDGVFDARRK